MSADNPNAADQPQKPQDPTTIGGNKYVFNPVTGQYETSTPRGQLATVGGHTVLLDPYTGEVIQDYGAAGGGATHTTERIIDPAQIEVEKLRAQNQIDVANLQNQAANARTEAERQTALAQLQQKYAEMAQQGGLSAAQLTGSYNGTPTLDARKFGFDQFKYLSDLASNPRNFMQDFFVRRGFQPPSGVDRYSNTYGMNGMIPGFLSAALAAGSVGGGTPQQPFHGAASIVPSNVGGSTTGAAINNHAPAGSIQYSPTPAAPAGLPPFTPSTQYQTPGNPITAVDSNGASAPVQLGQAPGQELRGVNYTPIGFNAHADAPVTLPNTPGGVQPTGGYSADQKTIDQYVSQHGTPDAQAAAQSRLASFARGGIVPEPVAGVGLHSGHRYMFGEKGPEGVVPANYLPKFLQSRHGRQMSMPNGMPMGSQGGPTQGYSEGGMVGYPSNGQDGINMYAVGGLIGDNEDPNLFTDPSQPPDLPYNETGPSAPYYGPTPDLPYTETGPSAPYYPPAPDLPYNQTGPSAPYYAPTPPANPTPSQTPQPPAPPPPAAPAAPPPVGAQPPAAPPAPVDRIERPPAAPVGAQPPQRPPAGQPPAAPPVSPARPEREVPSFVPTFVPQNGQFAPTNVPGAMTPRDLSAPGTFGPSVGASSAFSTFAPYLPHFLPGEDTPLTQLTDQGILPPFLGRLFAQQQGAQPFGTNQPQRFDLPNGVPLTSRLAYYQMSPSERAAFQSYISSFGIDPQDYFDYVDQVSPHGGAASTPNFGTGIQFYRQ